ncbi:MAG TPA: DUF1491 family protein [Novosphingobium sp.]|nr:DUF1491 family protein [Novosphingobium sp.]
MTEVRLPAHLEVASLIRLVTTEGGFAAVLHKGHREAGTLLVVLTENGANSAAYERMPQADGSRKWTCSRRAIDHNPSEFSEYVARRSGQDPDLWVIELDIVRGERFIGLDAMNR